MGKKTLIVMEMVISEYNKYPFELAPILKVYSEDVKCVHVKHGGEHLSYKSLASPWVLICSLIICKVYGNYRKNLIGGFMP